VKPDEVGPDEVAPDNREPDEVETELKADPTLLSPIGRTSSPDLPGLRRPPKPRRV
jgi:hypothetical protein